MPNEGVYRVMHLLKKNDEVHIAISDLLVELGGACVVLEWASPLSKQDPLVYEELDLALLEVFEDAVIDYLYHGQIEYRSTKK